MPFALLAASAHNRCTSLVCSCYVASRNSDSKSEESSKSSNSNKRRSLATNKDGVMEEVCNNELLHGRGGKSNGCNGPHIEPTPLKSNLKKATAVETNQQRTETRKVSWPDAHGKDIAHVQVFETR
ncbi:unnamed protein product [Ilex paraguariensis]|uniref:Secreted protein n=1 Tax=Ilex paraguariensis TaxID=185542 RepID=A0ABC8RB83_9AQUA